MTPVAFDGLCATLHPAAGRRGLIILGSAGFEDLCAHRFLVALGDETARRGVPTLRFDLRGFGDSSPADLDSSLVKAWIEDVATAARWMQRDLGCTELAIAGLRLGALLAAGALDHPALDGCRLAILAPPASGKAYLRELKVFARVVASPPSAPGLEGLDLAGFHMPPSLAKGIEALDWSGLGRGAPRAVLVCGPVPPSLSSAATSAGHELACADFDGYDRLMCDPTASVVPGEVVRSVAAWLAAGALQGPRWPARKFTAVVDHSHWREEGLAFGPEGGLNGILCTSRRSTGSGGPIVVFTNPGGIRRAGWGNAWVDMARDLAAAGIASLRFDFSNLDADLDDAEPAFHYGDAVWSEITAVADQAEARGFGPLIVVGTCSGAYHCLRAAAFDPRIESAVLVNQLCYAWSSAHAMPLVAWMKQKASDFDRKRRAVDEDESELARLRAQLMLRGIKLAKTSAKSALRQLRALATLLPTGGRTESADATQIIRDLSARGCRLELVQSAGDASIAEYDQHVGLSPDTVPGLTRTIIDGADHLLTPHHARDVLRARIIAAADALRTVPERDAARA